jgi:hypothetical protein
MVVTPCARPSRPPRPCLLGAKVARIKTRGRRAARGFAMKIRGVPVRHVTEPTAPEQAFRFENGAVASTLVEFHERLADVPARTLDYHRTHFAPWVREVVRDEPLALRLESYGESGADAETLRDVLRDLVGARLRELAAGDAGPSSNR